MRETYFLDMSEDFSLPYMMKPFLEMPPSGTPAYPKTCTFTSKSQENAYSLV